MPNTDQVSEFLDLIVRELGSQYHLSEDRLSDLTVYEVDLAPLRLRMSTRTPFIVVTDNDIHRHGHETVADLVRQELIVRQDTPGSAVVVAEQNGGFLRFLGKDPYWAAVFDSAVVKRITKHTNPVRGPTASPPPTNASKRVANKTML